MKKSRYSILFLAAALIMTTGCTAQSLYRVYELPTDGVGGLVKKAAEALEPEGTRLEDVILLSNRNMWDQAIKKGKTQKDPNSSLFRYAVKVSTFDFAYYIIDHGANIQFVDRDGQNELMFLNQYQYSIEYSKFIKKLIENGCDINVMDKDGNNVLEDAVVKIKNDMALNVHEKKRIELLLEQGADLRPKMLSVLKEQQYICYSALKVLSDGLRKSNMRPESEDCVDAVILGDTEGFLRFFANREYNEEEKKRIVFYTAAVGTVDQLKQEISIWNIPFDYTDRIGNNLLMAAAAAGNEEVYFELIDKVSTDKVNDKRETLLTMALAGENETILDDLIKNKQFDWNYENIKGAFSCGLQLAETLSFCEDSKYLQLYLKSADLGDMAKELIFYIFISNRTPRFLDMIMQDTLFSPLAEETNASINILSHCTTSEQVRACLQFVSPEIRSDMAPALSNILGREGYGIIEDPAQIVREFVLAGVNPNEVDSDQVIYPIYAAAKTGDTESVEALLSYGADVNIISAPYGAPPLMVSAIGDAKILRILLENGADVNAADNEGNTALRYAVGFYAEDCVRILLEYGADKSIPLPDGRSLYEYAVEKGNEEIIELLK